MKFKLLPALISIHFFSMLALSAYAAPGGGGGGGGTPTVPSSSTETVIFSSTSSTTLNNADPVTVPESGAYYFGIGMTGADVTLNNTGAITVGQPSSWGIFNSCSSDCGNEVINNSGTILLTNNNSRGIQANGSFASISNTGNMTISGTGSYAIVITGANATASNSGTLSVASDAMLSSGASSTLSNSGTINNATPGYSIAATAASSTIINSGTIVNAASGTALITTAASSSIVNTGTIIMNSDGTSSTYAMSVGGVSSTLLNSGTISGTGTGIVGMQTGASGATFTNSGSITMQGNVSQGIFVSGEGTTILQTGNIQTSGSYSVGVKSTGDGLTLINSGTIQSTGDYAISVADNSTVTLQKGSLITGGIYASGSNNTLNIDVGQGTSYAYSVTGDWTVHDLDNRAFVTGSAYAAGVGAQQAAPELLHERISTLTASIDRHLHHAKENDAQDSEPWIDAYYGEYSRRTTANDSKNTPLATFHHGETIGFGLPSTFPLEALINFDHAYSNIDNSNQKISTDSGMLGIVAPNLWEMEGVILSSKLLVGYSKHKADRLVLTNNINANGSMNVTANYSSFYAAIGGQAAKSFTLSQHLKADMLFGIDAVEQNITAHAESAYYSWDNRHLTQIESRLGLGLEGRLLSDKFRPFIRVGAERWNLLKGKTQAYKINQIAVTYQGAQNNDTSYLLQIGSNYQVTPEIDLFVVYRHAHSKQQMNHNEANLGASLVF